MFEARNNSLAIIKGQRIVKMFEGIITKVLTTIARPKVEARELIPLIFENINKFLEKVKRFIKKKYCDGRRREVKAARNNFIVDLQKRQ